MSNIITPLRPWSRRSGANATYRKLAAACGRSLAHVYLCWNGRRKPGKELAELMQSLGWKGAVDEHR